MSTMQAGETSVAQDLVRRIKDGDRAAESELWRRYFPRVKFFLQSRTRNSHLVEDLTQETFVVVLTRLRDKGIRKPEALASFILQVARKLFIGHVRKESRQKTATDMDTITAVESPEDGPAAAFVRSEFDQIVRELISEMPGSRYREVLYRAYVLGQDQATIAMGLGLTVSNVNKAMSRARARFRKLVNGLPRLF